MARDCPHPPQALASRPPHLISEILFSNEPHRAGGCGPSMAGRAGASRASGARCAASAAPASARCLPGRPRGGAQPVLPAAAHASCRRQGGRGWCPPRARVEAPHDQSPGPAVGTSGCTPSGQPGYPPQGSGSHIPFFSLFSKFCRAAAPVPVPAEHWPYWGRTGSRDRGIRETQRQ